MISIKEGYYNRGDKYIPSTNWSGVNSTKFNEEHDKGRVITINDFIDIIRNEVYGEVQKENRPAVCRSIDGYRPTKDKCDNFSYLIFLDIDLKKLILNNGNKFVDSPSYKEFLVSIKNDFHKYFKTFFHSHYIFTSLSTGGNGIHIWLNGVNVDYYEKIVKDGTYLVYYLVNSYKDKYGFDPNNKEVYDKSAKTIGQPTFVTSDKDILVWNNYFIPHDMSYTTDSQIKELKEREDYWWIKDFVGDNDIVATFDDNGKEIKFSGSVSVKNTKIKLNVNKKIYGNWENTYRWMYTLAYICENVDSAFELWDNIYSWKDESGNDCFGEQHNDKTKKDRENRYKTTLKELFRLKDNGRLTLDCPSHIDYLLSNKVDIEMNTDDWYSYVASKMKYSKYNEFYVDNAIGKARTYYEGDYLSDIKSELNNFINDYNAIYLESSPGTGKTNLTYQEFYSKDGKKYHKIVLEPLVSICKSKYDDDNSNRYYMGREYNGNINGLTDVFVFDSFFLNVKNNKITFDNNTLIFLDESHSIIGDSTYRDVMYGIIPLLKELIMKYGVKVVLMTGTPLCENRIFNNAYHIRFKKKEDKRKLKCNYVFSLKPSESSTKYICDSIKNNHIVMIYANWTENKTNQFADKLKKVSGVNFKWYNIRRDNRDEEDLKEIFETADIKDIQVIFATSYFGVGSEIKNFSTSFNGIDIFFISIESPYICDQFANRFRGVDLNSYIFTSRSNVNIPSFNGYNTYSDDFIKEKEISAHAAIIYNNNGDSYSTKHNIFNGLYYKFDDVESKVGEWTFDDDRFELDYNFNALCKYFNTPIIHKVFMTYYGWECDAICDLNGVDNETKKLIKRIAKNGRERLQFQREDFANFVCEDLNSNLNRYGELEDYNGNTFKDKCKKNELPTITKDDYMIIKKGVNKLKRCNLIDREIIDVISSVKGNFENFEHIIKIYDLINRIYTEKKSKFFNSIICVGKMFADQEFIFTEDTYKAFISKVNHNILYSMGEEDTYDEYFENDTKYVIESFFDKDRKGKNSFVLKYPQLPYPIRVTTPNVDVSNLSIDDLFSDEIFYLRKVLDTEVIPNLITSMEEERDRMKKQKKKEWKVKNRAK